MLRVLVLCLVLLVAAAQQQVVVHALQHDATRLGQSTDMSWHLPGELSCATCVLLAGTASALTGPVRHAVDVAFRGTSVTAAPDQWVPRALRYYSSRAPPPPPQTMPSRA